MLRATFYTIYNLALPLLTLLSLPRWIVKTLQRDGKVSDLLQRLSLHSRPAELETTNGLYLHAVSVGEANLALKLIRQWHRHDPSETFTLAVTTPTAHQLVNQQFTGTNSPPNTHLIFAPLDFPLFINRTLNRFAPRQIILLESELWPNLLRLAKNSAIPLTLANARLSPRSEKRYQKILPLTHLITGHLTHLCYQEKEDQQRWKNLGLPDSKLTHTGSIKFDNGPLQQIQGPSVPKDLEIEDLLRTFDLPHKERPILLGLSTHPGEELHLAQAIANLTHLQPNSRPLPVIVPRHVERRDVILHTLTQAGFEVHLRTRLTKATQIRRPEKAVLILDTTGELPRWIPFAHACIVGKSLLPNGNKGGQNPVEPLLAHRPTICGEFMANFEPLVTRLTDNQGLLRSHTQQELTTHLQSLLHPTEGKPLAQSLLKNALQTLAPHENATQRTIQTLSPFCKKNS